MSDIRMIRRHDPMFQCSTIGVGSMFFHHIGNLFYAIDDGRRLLTKLVLPSVSGSVNPRSLHPSGSCAANVERIPRDQPHLVLLAHFTDLVGEMVVYFGRRLEALYRVYRDDVLEDRRMRTCIHLWSAATSEQVQQARVMTRKPDHSTTSQSRIPVSCSLPGLSTTKGDRSNGLTLIQATS